MQYSIDISYSIYANCTAPLLGSIRSTHNNGPAAVICKYNMRAFVVKPVPIDVQKRFEKYAKSNAYRFVFFCYGTVSHESPYYALYTWEEVDPLALLYVSEYIVEEIIDYASEIRNTTVDR